MGHGYGTTGFTVVNIDAQGIQTRPLFWCRSTSMSLLWKWIWICIKSNMTRTRPTSCPLCTWGSRFICSQGNGWRRRLLTCIQRSVTWKNSGILKPRSSSTPLDQQTSLFWSTYRCLKPPSKRTPLFSLPMSRVKFGWPTPRTKSRAHHILKSGFGFPLSRARTELPQNQTRLTRRPGHLLH